jgi:hypothetical protein
VAIVTVFLEKFAGPFTTRIVPVADATSAGGRWKVAVRLIRPPAVAVTAFGVARKVSTPFRHLHGFPFLLIGSPFRVRTGLFESLRRNSRLSGASLYAFSGS